MEGRFGQSEIFRGNQQVVIRDKQCGKENLVPATQLYSAEIRERPRLAGPLTAAR